MAHDRALDVDRSPDVFERAYAAPGSGFDRIPWARLGPRPELVEWFAAAADRSEGAGRALVVGCGLGDDAEYVAGLGYAVTAFDLSPSAVALCRERFPTSTVTYRVGDVFALDWAAGGFDLVVEVYTLQSIDPEARGAAIPELAATLAPGGTMFLRCFARNDDDPPGPERPWPMSRAELSGFETAGLIVVSSTADEPPARGLTVVYRRP